MSIKLPTHVFLKRVFNTCSNLSFLLRDHNIYIVIVSRLFKVNELMIKSATTIMTIIKEFG